MGPGGLGSGQGLAPGRHCQEEGELRGGLWGAGGGPGSQRGQRLRVGSEEVEARVGGSGSRMAGRPPGMGRPCLGLERGWRGWTLTLERVPGSTHGMGRREGPPGRSTRGAGWAWLLVLESGRGVLFPGKLKETSW